MSRTKTVRARVDPNLKAEVDDLLQRLGLTTTEAITLFYTQIRLRQGLPFSVEIPNETTKKTFEATDRGENLNSYQSLDQLFAKLDQC